MITKWADMRFWESGEFQVILDHWAKYDEPRGDHYVLMNPEKQYAFTCLDICPFDTVKVAIFGQDPYPDHKLATGVAFSVPYGVPPENFPLTLRTILREYSDDLTLPKPNHGNLEYWCSQGVLLYNVYPTCEEHKSLSHPYEEYNVLCTEVIRELNTKGNVVFVFLGTVARRFSTLVQNTVDLASPWDLKNKGIVQEFNNVNCSVLELSHPSPRGALASRSPFLGSRLFSSINRLLVQEHGVEPIDWRLLDV